MATAGAGDVLTGVITSFIAQGFRPEQAATLGVFIHGMAGDLALEKWGEHGVMASDIAENCALALKKITNR